MIYPCLFHKIIFECCFRKFNTNCPLDLSVTGKLCVNVVSKFTFPSFALSIEAFCKGCAVAFLSSFALLNLFNSSSVCNVIFSFSEIPARFQTVLRFSWVQFMVDAIWFTGVSAFMSSISYTSGAFKMYFFPSAIYPSVIPFNRWPTKFPRMGASKGSKKAPPSWAKISSVFFCGGLGFTSSRILPGFLLIFVFSRSLTLILLLIILMVYSQIALILSGFKCFTNYFFCPLEEKCNAVSTGRFFLIFLDMMTVP